MCYVIADAPVFTMGPIYPITGVIEGGNVTLTCNVKADPIELDHIHWYDKDGKKITVNTTAMMSKLMFRRCVCVGPEISVNTIFPWYFDSEQPKRVADLHKRE